MPQTRLRFPDLLPTNLPLSDGTCWDHKRVCRNKQKQVLYWNKGRRGREEGRKLQQKTNGKSIHLKTNRIQIDENELTSTPHVPKAAQIDPKSSQNDPKRPTINKGQHLNGKRNRKPPRFLWKPCLWKQCLWKPCLRKQGGWKQASFNKMKK